MTEVEQLKARLTKALWLLREWRDKYGGKDHHKFSAGGHTAVSEGDLARDTRHFLEGK